MPDLLCRSMGSAGSRGHPTCPAGIAICPDLDESHCVKRGSREQPASKLDGHVSQGIGNRRHVLQDQVQWVIGATPETAEQAESSAKTHVKT